MLEWGIHERILYELEGSGQLLAMSIGNRVWYSRAQLTQLLGDPPSGGAGGPVKMSRTSDKPSNQRRFEFEEGSKAA